MKTARTILLISILLLTACTSTPPPPTPTATPPPQPTATPYPLTPTPTSTPPPTDTPVPTSTPEPTLPPTPVPEPLILTGSGDAILDLDWWHQPAIIHITGNAAGRHFAVRNFDANNEPIDLLVNTSNPYEGYRPIDWDDSDTTRLEITASDAWTIELFPFAPSPQVNQFYYTPPITIEGTGDTVIILGATPDLATISGNAAGRHFAIIAWTATRPDLLVNTADPYEGTVMCPADTFGLEIKAEGTWTIELTAK